jgi:hypothetical protein
MVFAFAAPTLNLDTERRICPSSVALAFLVALAGLPVVADAETVDLRGVDSADSHQQVRVVVEVEGKLRVNLDGKAVQHVPMKATAELQYVERTLAAGKAGSGGRAVRHYEKAEAQIRLRETDLTNSLRPERRIIVLDAQAAEPTQFSPLGPLTREELELIEVPASAISLTALLPEQPLAIGGEWKLSDKIISRLFNLEAVSQQTVAGKLDSVKDGIAIASLEGTVAGAIGGVSSDLEMKGKLNFDLKRRAVTWLTLAIQEKRAIGHTQPGFEVVTRLRMVAAPSSAAPEVSDQSLTGLPTTAASGQSLIELTSEKGGFQLAHDRRWGVMVERHDATMLRLVDRGDLIAQCNISPLPAFTKGEVLTLEGFQNDVKQALGKNFGEVVEAAQEAGEGEIVIQRITVSGTAGELPIQWTYYHVFDDNGHRASLVFTIEGKLVERFAQIDRELISGYRFLPDKLPTPALSGADGSAQKPMPSSKTK